MAVFGLGRAMALPDAGVVAGWPLLGAIPWDLVFLWLHRRQALQSKDQIFLTQVEDLFIIAATRSSGVI